MIFLCVYVQGSWRRKLRTKFKNLRRPKRALKAGIAVSPPPKKMQSCSVTADVAVQSASDVAQYNRHVAFIQQSFSSKKWSVASMLTLLEETAGHRRSWIRNECPSVRQVLEKFSCLEDPQIVSYVCCILNML